MNKKKQILILIFLFSTCIFAQQTRFMVVADPHIFSPSADFNQTILYELTLSAIAEQVDFIFFPGDLVIKRPADSSLTDTVLKDWRFVLDTLNHHDIRVFACRGNRDAGSGSVWVSLFSGDYSFPANGPEMEMNRTYAIEYNNMLFLSLDQYFNSHRINQAWLDEILNLNTKPHIFAAGHEPAFEIVNESYMGVYPGERDTFWGSLSQAGAKAFFSGHDHFFDHTIMADSTGLLKNNVHQIIVGTGGGYLFSDDDFDGNNGRWEPIKLSHDNKYGYLLMEVNDLDVRMIWKYRTGKNIFEDGGDSYAFLPTSIDNIDPCYNTLQIYPNPFSQSTTLFFNNPDRQSYILRITDLSGKICRIVDDIKTGEYILEKGDLKKNYQFIPIR